MGKRPSPLCCSGVEGKKVFAFGAEDLKKGRYRG
jgi:hypothetical protein